MKSLLAIFLIATVIGGFSIASIINFGSAQSGSSFKISGYILDSNGHGIAGANIIFNVPQIVPSVFSDSSGYYAIYAPAGTYHVNVWPPFDSNYIFYDQQGFVVGSDITKNITLSSGCKVSGYIFDLSGKPVKNAIVLLGSYLSAWYSKDTGYYFTTAPAGTYTLTARPANGIQNAPNFPTYYEYNFVVNGNLAKNITVGSPTPTPANTLGVELQPKYDGQALFTNEKVHSSPKSVRLVIPKNASQGSYAMALYPYNGTLSSIANFSIFTSYTTAVPRFMLCLANNHSWADTFLLSDYQLTSDGGWKATTGGNRWGWTETNIDLTNYGQTWNTFDYWVAKYGNLKVLYIGIVLEYWAVDPDGFGEPLYADELILNGVKYNIAPVSTPTPTPNPSSFKISGYILDANGHGIGGANIIFNVPSIVPSVWSDSSGYYVISAPVGTYHVNVWPPFDSNYINYDAPEFVVGSDMTKNITLYSGYKVSGYISDSSGTPVVGAAVLLRNSVKTFGSGWFSNNAGYYFLSVPAGTYTIDAHPRTGNYYSGPTTNFPTYYEYNFTVNSNTIKNITVGGTSPSPSPTPSPSPSPSPSPTPPVNATPAQITISTDTTSAVVGSVVNVNGKLSRVNGTSLPSKLVTLSYAISGNSTWVPIGSAITNDAGEYNIQWVNAGSGTFTLKVEWVENAGYPGISNTTTLSFLPYNGQTLFFVESNSTVTTLAFKSTSSELSFAVSGPENTTGYIKATIAKSLISNASETKVYVDGNLLGYTLTETSNAWVLTFSYHHSTHQVKIAMATNTTTEPIILGGYWMWAAVVVIVIVVGTGFFTLWQIKKKQKTLNSA